MQAVDALNPSPAHAFTRTRGLLVLLILGIPAGAGAGTAEEGPAPPPQFAICAACHSTASDGSHSMGPNLRGVVGRKAGSAPGFQYSSAMRDSGIRWTPQELDSFLTDVPAKVPGTLMPINGLPDPADRQAVIRYLKSLK